MQQLIQMAKHVIYRMPPPLRLGMFVGIRGVARQVTPRYRRTARMYAVAGGGQQKIQGGPFKGVKYISMATGSTTMPKLLGTYEMELYDAVEKMCRLEPDVIADLGSAEGYYAVGLAVRLPRTKVFCYDIDPFARYLLQRLARRNKVSDRVIQKQACDPQELERVLSPAKRPAVIVDVDGPEDQLLRPDLTPSLRRAFLIIELHDFINPGVTQRLRERFEATHTISMFQSRERTPADLPPGIELSNDEAIEAMAEARQGPQDWSVMVPKDSV